MTNPNTPASLMLRASEVESSAAPRKEVLEVINKTFSLGGPDGEAVLRNGKPLALQQATKAAYRKVHICRFNGTKETLLLSRLKFYLAYGEWPAVVDHINGNTRDNRLDNLRAATQQQNIWNSRPPRKNGTTPRGVVKKGDRFEAGIKQSGKWTYLGTYNTEAEASAAYQAESKKRRGAFYRARRKQRFALKRTRA